MPALLLAAGCHAFGPSNCSTPEVTGRVLAADTRQPLAGVSVSRVLPGQSVTVGPPAYGAQQLQAGRPEITGADGRFTVPGASCLTLFRHSSWWSVRLAFQAPGYVLYQTNFSTASLTNLTAASQPSVNAGDILLPPLRR